MKFSVALCVVAVLTTVLAGPVSITDNNVGDIVSVGVNANLDVSNQLEVNILSILALLLNQNLGGVSIPTPPNLDGVPKPAPKDIFYHDSADLPVMINKVENVLKKDVTLDDE